MNAAENGWAHEARRLKVARWTEILAAHFLERGHDTGTILGARRALIWIDSALASDWSRMAREHNDRPPVTSIPFIRAEFQLRLDAAILARAFLDLADGIEVERHRDELADMLGRFTHAMWAELAVSNGIAPPNDTLKLAAIRRVREGRLESAPANDVEESIR